MLEKLEIWLQQEGGLRITMCPQVQDVVITLKNKSLSQTTLDKCFILS